MIHVSRRVLREIAKTYVLANTSYSLLNGLKSVEIVKKMREDCSYDQLKQYYEKLTSKARRSEIVVAFAYAVLISLLTHTNKTRDLVDSSRLDWGLAIEKFVSMSTPSNNRSTIIFSSDANTSVRVNQSLSTN